MRFFAAGISTFTSPRGHEDDDGIASVLRRIGTPYIVKCAVPLAGLRSWVGPVSARFLSQLVSADVPYPEPPPSFDLFPCCDLPGSSVLDCISFPDSQFRDPTGCNGWESCYKIA
jgi:hypothetical protein